MIKYATYDYKSQLTVDLFKDYDNNNNGGGTIEVEGDSELGNPSSTYTGNNTFNHYIEINFNESIKNKIVACSFAGSQVQFKIKLTEKIQQKVGYFFVLGFGCPYINVSSDFKSLYISYPKSFPNLVSTLYLFDDTNYDTSKAKSIKVNCILFNDKKYLDNLLNTTYGSFNVIDLTSNNITNGSEVKFIGKLPYSQNQYCYKFKIEKSKFTKSISKIQGYFNDILLLTYDFKVNKNYKVDENYILIWSYFGGICFDEDSNYYYLYCLILFFNLNHCPKEFGNKLRVLFKDSNEQTIFNFSLNFKVNDEFFNLLPMYNLNSTNVKDFNLTVPTLFIKRKNLPKFNDYNLLIIDSKYKDDDYLSFYDLNTVDNNIIYEKSLITFDSTKYTLENLKKNLDLKKPFVIKGNLKLPNEIKTSGYNFIWRIFSLYFVGNNITDVAGDLQFRYHNNINSSSLQKYFIIGSNFLLKENLIFENVESTILTSLDFIFYYNNKKINALVKTKSLVTVDKEVTEQKYADRILFGRPPSISYEKNTGTITVKNLKIYQ